MITIHQLSRKKAEEMKEELGNHIFKNISPYKDGDVIVSLCDYAEIKFYNFDNSVTIQLGAKKCLLENEDYWRIELA